MYRSTHQQNTFKRSRVGCVPRAIPCPSCNKVVRACSGKDFLGQVTALLFAREGAKLIVTARRQSELDTLVVEIEAAGGKAVAIAGDVKDEALVCDNCH